MSSPNESASVKVEEVAGVTDELVAAFARLIPQLSSSNPPPSAAALEQIVTAEDTHLLVSRDDDGTITGTTTLVVFRIPTGLRAWIEEWWWMRRSEGVVWAKP